MPVLHLELSSRDTDSAVSKQVAEACLGLHKVGGHHASQHVQGFLRQVLEALCAAAVVERLTLTL